MSIHGHLNLWSLHPAVHPSHLYLSASLICIHHSLPPYCPNDPSFCHKVSLLTFLQDNMCTTLLVSMIILALVFQSSVNTSWSGRASHLFPPKPPQNALLFRPSPLCPLSLSSSSPSPSESSSKFSFTLFGYILTYPYFTVRTGYSPAVSSCLCSYMSPISWTLYRNPEPELKTSNGGKKKKTLAWTSPSLDALYFTHLHFWPDGRGVKRPCWGVGGGWDRRLSPSSKMWTSCDLSRHVSLFQPPQEVHPMWSFSLWVCCTHTITPHGPCFSSVGGWACLVEGGDGWGLKTKKAVKGSDNIRQLIGTCSEDLNMGCYMDLLL